MQQTTWLSENHNKEVILVVCTQVAGFDFRPGHRPGLDFHGDWAPVPHHDMLPEDVAINTGVHIVPKRPR